MPSLGAMIVARCKRDREFRKQVLQILYKKLSAAEFKSEYAKRLRKACAALEKL